MKNIREKSSALNLLWIGLAVSMVNPAYVSANDPIVGDAGRAKSEEIVPGIAELAAVAQASAGVETSNLCTAETTTLLRDKIITAQNMRIMEMGYAQDVGSAVFKAEMLRGTAFGLSLVNIVLSIYAGKMAFTAAAKAASETGWGSFVTALKSWDKVAWTRAWALERAVAGPIKEMLSSFAIAGSIYKDHKDVTAFKNRLRQVTRNLKGLKNASFAQYHLDIDSVPLPKNPGDFWHSFQGAPQKAASQVALIHGYLYATEEAVFSEIFREYAVTCSAAEGSAGAGVAEAHESWQVAPIWMGACKMTREWPNGKTEPALYSISVDRSKDGKRDLYTALEQTFEDYNQALDSMLSLRECSSGVQP